MNTGFLRILTSACLLLLAPVMAGAQPAASPAGHEQAKEIVTVRVNGMVCDFCVQSVHKLFSREEAVETVDVDLGKGTVSITMRTGRTLDDERIRKLVRQSGYSPTGIDRGGQG